VTLPKKSNENKPATTNDERIAIKPEPGRMKSMLE
jgi:hypothetical protein